MGIGKPIEEYEKYTLNSLKLKYKGLKWCELGNQKNYENKVAKYIYLSLGVKHISIDLNGDDGALPINLDQPIPFIFLTQFDVITNYGTIEHINNQFQVFKNIHDSCKLGGIMIHLLPPIGNWPGHCRYYYSKKFVTELANACCYQMINYRILDKFTYKTPRNFIAVTYIKKHNNKFITKEKFNHIGGLIDTGNLTRTGNYSKRAVSVIRNIIRRLK